MVPLRLDRAINPFHSVKWLQSNFSLEQLITVGPCSPKINMWYINRFTSLHFQLGIQGIHVAPIKAKRKRWMKDYEVTLPRWRKKNLNVHVHDRTLYIFILP